MIIVITNSNDRTAEASFVYNELQTELIDTHSHCQLNIKITISEKRRIISKVVKERENVKWNTYKGDVNILRPPRGNYAPKHKGKQACT